MTGSRLLRLSLRSLATVWNEDLTAPLLTVPIGGGGAEALEAAFAQQAACGVCGGAGDAPWASAPCDGAGGGATAGSGDSLGPAYSTSYQTVDVIPRAVSREWRIGKRHRRPADAGA